MTVGTRGAGIVVVVGNPKPASRTRAAAEAVARALAGLIDDDASIATIDLADHAAALLEWGSPDVARLKATTRSAAALVVASPTYKAAYTGLLKLFLDQFDKDELGGVPTVPVMTGGNAGHALAVEVHLRPVLVEIGASQPSRGVFFVGPEVDDPEPVVDEWLTGAREPLRRALA
ncbi:MAG TPA: NAD(P)H-dependent oxidoreductase [Acidimicrobiales bacterium]|nr:NAD(P)H-dependent oxidoreductase [Acidimicrobiales bacterium]